MLYFVPGRGIVDDQAESIPEYNREVYPGGQVIEWGTPGTEPLATYQNPAQFNAPFQWDPARMDRARAWENQGVTQSYPDYVQNLLFGLEAQRTGDWGQMQPWEREAAEASISAARGIPTRDISGLQVGYADEGADWWSRLNPLSPDVGPILLQIADKMQQGTATEHERGLFEQVKALGTDWNYRASVPQASDAFNPLGNELFGALSILGIGAGGFGALGPLLAGGLSTAGTLGAVGGLAGSAGGLSSMFGQALDVPALAKAGSVLGALGGLAGGAGGLANLWGTGVNSLADAARLAGSAGKITGSLGNLSGVGPLQQAGKYLGMAGQLGRGASGVQGLLSAASQGGDELYQPGPQDLRMFPDEGGRMAEGDWLDFETDDWWGGDTQNFPTPEGGWGGTPDYMQSDAYKTFTGWGDPTGPGSSGDMSGGSNWLSSILGGLGSIGGFLGKNAGLLGPAASALGSLGGGAIGSNAANDAARLQAAALNRGIDLQTAQWLQSQANQAPWMEAGRGALGELTWRQAQEQSPTRPEATPAISGAGYALPSATPGWTPQNIDAGAYRWTPGQGPQAANYRYQPGNIPSAATYRYTPGAVPTLSGKELLANDPGVQFRLDRAQRALETSAAARGGLLSGGNLQALQAQGQDLASQEYGQAWGRASQQAQLRENWAQAASQMGWGQAEAEARLREQVNQIASQQGWSQAQAEAVFREQMAQQASQQGFSQGLQGQQWNQQQAQQYQQELYNRLFQQSQVGYGRDVAENLTNYDRQQQAYNQQIADMTRQWNQAAGLAGVGQTAVGQLGQQGAAAQTNLSSLLAQLGSAQGVGAYGSGLNWQRALTGAGNQIPSLLAGLNA